MRRLLGTYGDRIPVFRRVPFIHEGLSGKILWCLAYPRIQLENRSKMTFRRKTLATALGAIGHRLRAPLYGPCSDQSAAQCLGYAHTTVSFTLEKNGGKTYIHVDDDGPGIPLNDREHLFEPFTRLDQSRTRSTGGFGLGLSIVKQIARWHRGDAAIGDSPLGGARVTICW